LVHATTSTISPAANSSTGQRLADLVGFSTLSQPHLAQDAASAATLAFLKWPARGLDTFFFAG